MQIQYKEKALLANKYKIERAERNKNWIGRNWINVLLFGVFISIVGPAYTSEADGIYRKESVSALELSDFGYFGTVLCIAIWYAACMTIAYFTWKYQDNRKIKNLKKQRTELLRELDLLKKQI